MPSGDAFEGGAPLATQLGRKQPHGNWDSKQHFGHEAGRKAPERFLTRMALPLTT